MGQPASDSVASTTNNNYTSPGSQEEALVSSTPLVAATSLLSPPASNSNNANSGSNLRALESCNSNKSNDNNNQQKFLPHLDRQESQQTNQQVHYYQAAKRIMGQQQHYYYTCQLCGDQGQPCKCSTDGRNLGEKLTSPVCTDEDQPYLMAGVSPEHHRSPTSSASSSSYHSGMMHMQDEQQQQQQYDHDPQQQLTNNQSHTNHQNQQDHFQFPAQQVSSRTDHPSNTISAGDAAGGQILAAGGASQLAYNYEEQNEACADTWSGLDVDTGSGGHHLNSCSSRTDLINQSPLADHQSSSTYQLNLGGSLANEQQRLQQQLLLQEAADQLQQEQTYSQSVISGNVRKSAITDHLEDFNNNQDHQQTMQHQRQPTIFSALVPMEAVNNLAQSHLQGSPPTYCNNLNAGQQIFQTSNNNSIYYQYNQDCNEPTSASYHHNHHISNHYHQDEYNNHHQQQMNLQQQQILPSFQATMNNGNSNQSRQSPTSNSMTASQISRISANSFDMNHPFQQRNQSNHLDCYQSPHQQHHPAANLLKTPQNATQFQQQISHHEGDSHCQQQQQQHYLQDQSQYKLNPNHQQQHQFVVCANDQPDSQYPFRQHPYTSLQQLTTNCDSFSNQVTTTTNTTNDPNSLPSECAYQSPNKARTLKGRRGRPRKKGLRSKNKVNGKLWEFIRDLLLNERTNPTFIRWERREDGVFKFVQSDKVAKMWGERKQNPKMTYEKLSRAMRYYYKSKVLLPVFGRRLVYKFGPNATGWLPSANDTVF